MEIKYQKNTHGYLDITFHPKWDYIAITRLYVENFLQINMADKDNIHKVGTAASELLENANKFSTENGIRMIVKKSKVDKIILLSVFNHASKELADKLKARIEEMNQWDSLEYYIHRMKESVKNKKENSQLGLARINHEGQAQISAFYHEDDGVLEVKAIFCI
ncbi:MAG: hypothetical protein JXJ04_25635 [Spirochaetales bacterium]|nr:hypothetical protein [Spirochaetales bacterium]